MLHFLERREGEGPFSGMNWFSGKAVWGGDSSSFPREASFPTQVPSVFGRGETLTRVHTQMWSSVALNVGEAALELTGTAMACHPRRYTPLITHRLSGTTRLLALFSFLAQSPTSALSDHYSLRSLVWPSRLQDWDKEMMLQSGFYGNRGGVMKTEM